MRNNTTQATTSKTTEYEYDQHSRLTKVTNGNASKSYDYDSFGRVYEKITRHGSTTISTESITYETANGKTNGRVTELENAAGTFGYTYDANRNILSITFGGKTTTYTYDSQNQLTRENNQAGGYTYTWEYDNAGNIVNRKEYAYTTGTLGAVVDTISYDYGNANWGDLLTSYDGQTITYDTIGNPLSYYNGNRWTFNWENGRELATMTKAGVTWTNTYDANGMRTRRTNGSTYYEYVYDGSTLSQMRFGANVLDFIYGAEGTPLAVIYSGSYYYYVTNAQGDVVALLNSSGNTVVTYTYDAWGNPISTTGTMAAILGTLNPLRYRGYVYDTETGFYYLQSRYYDPTIGRFLNADGLVSTGQGVLGNNMFAYCLNNPVLHNDSHGDLAIPFFLDAFLGDGAKKKYGERSRLARSLKKSKAVLNEFDKNVKKFIDSGATKYGTYFGSLSTYDASSLNDYDLSLTVGRARYIMTIQKETRTKGILWWRREESRYVAQVSVWDSYDFTEWFSGSSFGSIMNNIAFIGQAVGLVVPYDWSVSFTVATRWG